MQRGHGSAATGGQYDPTITSDGSGGAIVTWEDLCNASTYNIYQE
ncbi:MAG TPA: hypothetical protein VMT60_03715 [Candidatus Bathyarchaeia archaeon]|nr:hypothetical protein [Candidatus Bathyarchaeia archaeon]